MTEVDDEVKEAAERAAMLWLGQQLESGPETGEEGRRERGALARAAAQEICRRAGILDVLKGLSMDGELSIPPPWPATDIVPVGGGPGFLDVEVRTMDKGRKRTVPLRMVIPGNEERGPERSEKIRAGIADAKERGDWELRKHIAGFASVSRR